MKSLVRLNAEKDPTYTPYCLRCPRLVRMVIVEPFVWKCSCGASADERDKPCDRCETVVESSGSNLAKCDKCLRLLCMGDHNNCFGEICVPCLEEGDVQVCKGCPCEHRDSK